MKSTVLSVTVAFEQSLWSARQRLRNDGGQTVAEYAIVLLVVAAIAVAFLVWARQSGRLDAFFDMIFERLLSSVDEEAAMARR